MSSLAAKIASADISTTAGQILTKVGVWIHHSKKSGRSRHEAPSLAAKNGSVHISEAAGPNLTEVGVLVDAPCESIILKNRTIEVRMASAELLPLFWKVLGLSAKGLRLSHAALSQGAKRLGLRHTAPICFP